MLSKLFVLFTTACLLCASGVSAVPLLINNGLDASNPDNVVDSEVSDGLVVRNDGCVDASGPCTTAGAPTQVVVTDGALIGPASDTETNVYDSSQLQIDGGTIFGTVGAYDDSSLHVSGGSGAALGFAFVEASGNATLTVDYGALVGGVTGSGSSSLFLNGSFDLGGVAVTDSASLLYGGAADSLSASGESSILMTGGSSSLGIVASDDARVHIEGGNVGFQLLALDGATITIAGVDFALDGVPIGFGVLPTTGGLLTGTLQSGDRIFVTNLFHGGLSRDGITYSGRIVLVPEPTAALLFGTGLLVAAAAWRPAPARRHLR